MNNLTKPHLLGVLAGFVSRRRRAGALGDAGDARLAEDRRVTDHQRHGVRRAVRSDLVVWRGSFTAEGNTLLTAQLNLKADLAKVEDFLKANAMTNYVIGPISIKVLEATEELKAAQKGESDITRQKTVGFRLARAVEVRSLEPDRVTRLDQEATTLVEQGVMLTSSPLEYIYTKAGEAKIEMLAEATKDARARAEQIASQGGRAIHQLRSAKMGVFQISPVYSLQTSWEGVNDTTSLEKTITAVVTASFSMK